VKKNLLITFGCSWTYGVGVRYLESMSKEEYIKIAWDEKICNSYSFRGLLAKKYNCTNINFAHGGSSNQKQFRLAKEFFKNKDSKENFKNYNKIIVLWGITSTARNEIYSTKIKTLFNFKMEQSEVIARFFLKNCYDHDNEVSSLSTEMLFWDDYFYNANIKNIWFDTFNHHDYKEISENLIGHDRTHRDIFSELVNYKANEIKSYHLSSWINDDPRINVGLKLKLINPISFHPTKSGHEKITDIMSPYIEKIL